jgi:very-short-patch-repair endonuclease
MADRRPLPRRRAGTPLDRVPALRLARALAADQGGVVHRRQLAVRNVPRWVVNLELRTGRWQRTGRQTVSVHNGPLDAVGRRWVGVLEVGRRAALDGVSALQVAGVTGLSDEVVHVITPKGSTPAKPRGVRVWESRRFDEADVLSNGIRRTRPAVAAVHAALRARTDRQASYFLLLVVQQRAATVADLADVVATVRRHARRRLLQALVVDLAGGVESLGELDVAQDFRRRGLTEPERQVLRRRPSGTVYLDCDLPAYGITLEIDGSGHEAPQQRLSDLLRDISSATEGRTVIRLSLAAYRLDRNAVLDRLEALLVSRGWSRPAA